MTSPQPSPTANPHRWVETGAFILGVLILGSYGVAEALTRVGVKLGDAACDCGFPWGMFIVGALLIAPKMLGRVTAGRIWEGVGGLVTRRVVTKTEVKESVSPGTEPGPVSPKPPEEGGIP